MASWGGSESEGRERREGGRGEREGEEGKKRERRGRGIEGRNLMCSSIA